MGESGKWDVISDQDSFEKETVEAATAFTLPFARDSISQSSLKYYDNDEKFVTGISKAVQSHHQSSIRKKSLHER